jgi:hypothetical protein
LLDQAVLWWSHDSLFYDKTERADEPNQTEHFARTMIPNRRRCIVHRSYLRLDIRIDQMVVASCTVAGVSRSERDNSGGPSNQNRKCHRQIRNLPHTGNVWLILLHDVMAYPNLGGPRQGPTCGRKSKCREI